MSVLSMAHNEDTHSPRSQKNAIINACEDKTNKLMSVIDGSCSRLPHSSTWRYFHLFEFSPCQNQLFCASESMERSRSFLFVIFCYLEARKNLVFASICHSRRQGHSTMTPSTISKDARAGRLSALYDRHDDVVSCFSMANGVTIGGRSALAQALICIIISIWMCCSIIISLTSSIPNTN